MKKYELEFHDCLNEQEVRNVFENVDMRDVHIFSKEVEVDSFQPMVSVIITKNNTPLASGLKYRVRMENLGKLGIKLNL